MVGSCLSSFRGGRYRGVMRCLTYMLFMFINRYESMGQCARSAFKEVIRDTKKRGSRAYIVQCSLFN